MMTEVSPKRDFPRESVRFRLNATEEVTHGGASVLASPDISSSGFGGFQFFSLHSELYTSKPAFGGFGGNRNSSDRSNVIPAFRTELASSPLDYQPLPSQFSTHQFEINTSNPPFWRFWRFGQHPPPVRLSIDRQE
jgi:hypothetical protein